MARLVKSGYRATTLILGEGATSRDDSRSTDKRSGELDRLKLSMRKANRLLGIKNVSCLDFPDNRFDSVDLLDLVKAVEKAKNALKPDIIFTHYEKDLNLDHRLTYEAVVTATRPMQGECVREIYSFEILSSTEWGFPTSFSPDVFFDIKSTLKAKVAAMSAYSGELRAYPHPRSLKGIELNAACWGMKTGLGYAEAFKTVRVLR